MRHNYFEKYEGKRIAVVLDGKRNPTFFGVLTKIDREYFTIILKNEQGEVPIQMRQVVAISPYVPKDIGLGGQIYHDLTEIPSLDKLIKRIMKHRGECKDWKNPKKPKGCYDCHHGFIGKIEAELKGVIEDE